MIVPLARLLERTLNLPAPRTVPLLSRAAVGLAAALFLLLATVIVAYDDVFPAQSPRLKIGSVAQRDIHAPETITYISRVLTDERRAEAQAAVRPIYNPPDLTVSRTQTRLAEQILDYVENVRADTFATREQQVADLGQIAALTVDDAALEQLLALDAATWTEVRGEILRLLQQVLQEPIRDIDLETTLEGLALQVSLRFDDALVAVVVAFVGELVRPNTGENVEATASARQAAADAVAEEQISFQRGQIVVRQGTQIGTLEFEALGQLGLLQSADQRLPQIARALIAVSGVMIVSALYLARFRPSLMYTEPRTLLLLAGIFVVMLIGARLALGAEIYLFPSALLALLFLTIVGPQTAIIGTLGLALLTGIMASDSLEVAALIGGSGLMGALTLRRPERLNSYFVTGLLIALINVIVVATFNLTTAVSSGTEPPLLIVYSLLNGVLTAATAIIGLYLIGLTLNLPTALKLIELSQPNQPLLQRLLREAPGTYQHSLQVANLAEQAANAIGANAILVHVGALYHDIGKVLNPAFFTENQRDIGNPHDILNDPYRSADIIISHVTQGDAIARQNRLPNRVRDFICEHHGTAPVYVFHKQAVIRAGGDETAVDLSDFVYPGPRPQSRETGILMLADSCEATIRSMQPNSRQEIEQAVNRIIESRRIEGQLDDSSLTLNDLSTIKRIFVDILKATFHPRINYTEAIAKAQAAVSVPPPTITTKPDDRPAAPPVEAAPRMSLKTAELPQIADDGDDSPLPDVPPLPRSHTRTTATIVTAEHSTAIFEETGEIPITHDSISEHRNDE